MALTLADRVRDTTATIGTGTITLSGAAPTGYQTFESGVGNGNTTYYTINAGVDWEVGIGTYSSTGPTLTRDTVLASSANGAKVDFPAGTKDVFVTYPAGKAIADGYGILPVPNGGTGVATLTSGYLVKGNGTSAVSASVVYDDGTNVGIGTSSPGSGTRLNVSGRGLFTGGFLDPFDGTASGVSISYDTVNNIGHVASVQTGVTTRELRLTGSEHTFFIGGTERMRLDFAGNLGIGTSSPTAKLDVNADTVRVRTEKTPASATATGNAGDICWDANYVYVCVATNTWKRSALSTW